MSAEPHQAQSLVLVCGLFQHATSCRGQLIAISQRGNAHGGEIGSSVPARRG